MKRIGAECRRLPLSQISSERNGVECRRLLHAVRPFEEMPALPRYPLIQDNKVYIDAKAQEGGFYFNDMHEKLYEKYGPVVRQKSLNMITCFSPDALAVFNKEPKESVGVFDQTWALHDYDRLVLNKGSSASGCPVNPFLARGDEWRKGRMALNPYLFSPKAAKSYLDGINKASAAAVSQIENFQVAGDQGVGSFCQYASLDMFISISLGVQLRATEGDAKGRRISKALIDGLNALGEIAITAPWSRNDWLKFGAWKDFCKLWTAARKESKELIEEAIADPDAQGFLQTFMESDKSITLEQALEMNMILAVAAGDTTSSFLANTIVHLAENPDAQATLRQHLKEKLGGNHLDAAVKLPYLDACMMEAQRLTPTLPWQIIKNQIEDDLVIEGYQVPKGSSIIFSNVVLRKHIDNAEKYYPERYLPEAVKARKNTSMAWMDHVAIKFPWSHGSRSCVGSRVAKLEIKSLLSRLVQDYEFHTEKGQTYKHVTRTTTMPEPFPLIRFNKI